MLLTLIIILVDSGAAFNCSSAGFHDESRTLELRLGVADDEVGGGGDGRREFGIGARISMLILLLLIIWEGCSSPGAIGAPSSCCGGRALVDGYEVFFLTFEFLRRRRRRLDGARFLLLKIDLAIVDAGFWGRMAMMERFLFLLRMGGDGEGEGEEMAGEEYKSGGKSGAK